MSLPEESVAANTLPEVTTIPTGKKLIFTDPDTNEGGIITLENLTKQILQNLTSQTFTLDQGNLTLLQALNQLNSNNQKFIQGIVYVDITGKTIPAVTSNSFLDIDTGDNYKGAKNILFQSTQTSIIVISAYMSLKTKTWHIRVNNSTGAITNITEFPVKYLGFIS